jgi:signal peptidase I
VAYAVTWLTNRACRDVTGPSMQPTLAPGDRLIVVPSALLPPRRGALVVVAAPERATPHTVKRVAGVPGELVELRDGRLIVDGLPRAEPDVRIGDDRTTARWSLGAGQFVVLGDHRDASTDSRVLGPVHGADLVATVVARLRPWRWFVGGRRAQPRRRATTRSSGSSSATSRAS